MAGPREALAAPAAPRLLHIFSTFSPGGTELRAIDVMAAMPRDWRHQVIALDGRTEARAHVPAGLELELLPPPPRAGSALTVLRLRRLLRRLRPDLLLTYGWAAFDAVLAAATLPASALVHHEDGFNADEAQRFKLRRILARRLALRRARAVVVPSWQLERVATGLWLLPAGLVRRIPNGVRVAEFAAADRHPELRRELRLPADAIVIGAVGQLRAEKNIGRLLRAFAAAAAAGDLHLLLVGDGPERAALEAEAARLGVVERVRFAGHQTVVAPFYRVLDILAISSDTEQQPRALLEAMASSLPVVASEVGDIAAMLPPEQARFLVSLSGAAVEPEFAEHFATLARDPHARFEAGKLNRRRVAECYDFDRMTGAYRELYGQLLAGDFRCAV